MKEPHEIIDHLSPDDVGQDVEKLKGYRSDADQDCVIARGLTPGGKRSILESLHNNQKAQDVVV
jgi:hypothetical protein